MSYPKRCLVTYDSCNNFKHIVKKYLIFWDVLDSHKQIEGSIDIKQTVICVTNLSQTYHKPVTCNKSVHVPINVNVYM